MLRKASLFCRIGELVKISSLGGNMIRTVVIAAAIAAATVGGMPVAAASGKYANCTEAHQDGRWNIPQSDPDYWAAGDRDNDGIACEG